MYRERASGIPGAVLWRSDGGGTASVLPDGCMDVLWWNDRLVVAGPDEAAHISESAAHSITLGIRFASGTGPGYLGFPAHAVTSARVDLAELWSPRTVARVEGRLRAAVDAADLRGIAGSFEGAIAEHLRSPDTARSRGAMQLATLAAAGLSVGETARRVGYSERQLHRRSREDFGYGLSTLARVLRFQRALPALREVTPLATVAASAGYADQAHMSREVRALSGLTPTQLRASGAV